MLSISKSGLDMAERKRQWEKEDRRWAEEMRLKRMEFFDKRDSRKETSAALRGIVGALTEGIDLEMGKGAGGEVKTNPEDKGFQCQEDWKQTHQLFEVSQPRHRRTACRAGTYAIGSRVCCRSLC